MNAFGKRGGMGGGGRPQFGVAKPMKSSGGSAAPAPEAVEEAEQFPPVTDLTANLDGGQQDPGGNGMAAMDRLNNRQNGDGGQASSKAEGFEASVHRIKEQVLPRLLERVDPEAAATLSKEELAEEFRPIISNMGPSCSRPAT